MNVLQLVCSKCYIKKPYTDFPPSDTSGWGCKECRKLLAREKRGGCKSPREDISDKERKCQNCKLVKPMEEFATNKKCKFGHERTCLQCVYDKRNANPNFKDHAKEYKHQWHKDNKERLQKKWKEVTYPAKREQLIAYQKEYNSKPENKKKVSKRNAIWRANNRDKVTEYTYRRHFLCIRNGNNDLKGWQVAKLKELVPACVLCETTEDLTVDHIKALKNGGQNTISNCIRMCRSCNSSKGRWDEYDITETVTIDGHTYVTGVTFVRSLRS